MPAKIVSFLLLKQFATIKVPKVVLKVFFCILLKPRYIYLFVSLFFLLFIEVRGQIHNWRNVRQKHKVMKSHLLLGKALYLSFKFRHGCIVTIPHRNHETKVLDKLQPLFPNGNANYAYNPFKDFSVCHYWVCLYVRVIVCNSNNSAIFHVLADLWPCGLMAEQLWWPWWCPTS